MKLGIVVYSDHPETVWNAFRLGNFALNEGDSVQTFLLAKGVEAENLVEGKMVVKEQMQEYVDAGGEILACGTCLTLRSKEGGELCPLSTMGDLYNLIKESDKVVTF